MAGTCRARSCVLLCTRTRQKPARVCACREEEAGPRAADYSSEMRGRQQRRRAGWRRRHVIRNDEELEQRQAKLLVCQSMIAHARQTLTPDAFWKRARIWMEEWDRLDDEI